ncbi:MAG: carboxypeptidase M32 [Clostridia bacterium]|nr:carboxypeptidase M32 [Clostridia bacterium]
MDQNSGKIQKDLEFVRETLRTAELYHSATAIIGFDRETICPKKAMAAEGEVSAFLGSQAFRLTKSDEFIKAAENLYQNRDLLDELDRVMAVQLHRRYSKVRNITPEMNYEDSLIRSRAYENWLNGKRSADFSVFAPSLREVRDMFLRNDRLREEHSGDPYDDFLDDHERGVTQADLDEWFGRFKERMIPLMGKILKSGKRIRTDFLSRTVTDEQQRKMARYILQVLHYDFDRGTFATTEHPFTNSLGRDDVRITTNYKPNQFTANIYTVAHEGGHALFEQLQPREHLEHFIDSGKTSGMHESVSRFYENVIGRSPEFISLIFPKAKEIFAEQLSDVTERELYEGVNTVTPTLVRTEADEFTYTFHIILRYELEKEIVNGRCGIEDLPGMWNRKYREYLGIEPTNDREGILQDVHWTFAFGYFPTYALGNMYNAMYYNRMKEEFDVPAAVLAGDFGKINGWMAENVFRRADLIPPKQWIREICGRDFTPDDYISYLEKKYGAIYEI